MKMSTEEYWRHNDQYNGYCVACDEITRHGMTEPDARNYPCPDCEKRSCCGVEWAMVSGWITITD